jgi:hypothetical protein
MSNAFLITVVFIVFMIFILALMLWFISRKTNAAEELLMPRRRKLRKSGRSFFLRCLDVYDYWTRGGMDLRDAIRAAWRVI